MKKIFLLFSILFSTLTFAQSYSSPESVEYDDANNRWLVSSTNSNTIQQRDAAGVISLFVNTTGPYGMQIVGDTVYVLCSDDRIRGYSLSGANLGTNILISGAGFLNGLASDTSGNLYATDFSSSPKKIYRINIENQYYTTFATLASSSSPNGIIHDPSSNRLVFVHWGGSAAIKAISLVDSSVTNLVTTSYSNIDGIARDGNGNFYISAWGTQSIYKYDNAFTLPAVPVVTSGITNPADIYYSVALDTLGVPCATTSGANGNKVKFFGFGTQPPPTPTLNSISMEVTVDSFYCSNFSNYNLTYTVTNAFGTGNIFYAFLSDATGSFIVPDTIGSLASDTSGMISVDFENVPDGMGYRVKVVASTPASSSADNGFDLHVGLCGFVEEINSSSWKIIPNPVHQDFEITGLNSPIKSAALLDVQGKLILNFDRTSVQNARFNLSVQQAGMYFLKIETEEGTSIKKIVKN